MTPDPTSALRDVIRDLIREELRAVRDADRAVQADHPELPAGAPAREWINDRELAAWIAVSRETLQQWRSRGEGPPFRKVGRAVRYSVPEVRAWIADRRRGPTDHTTRRP